MSVPRFQFGLERVRQVRAHAEDLAKEQLAASLADRLRGEAVLTAAALRLQDAHSAAADTGDGPVSGATLLARQAWTDRLRRSHADAQQKVSQAQEVVDANRTELVAAAQRREVLDRLRERKLGEHRAHSARVEGAALDEMGLRVRGLAADGMAA